MKDWFIRNWKQMFVLLLSTGDVVAMHYHPEWHDWEALAAAFLASQGLRLLPITWTQLHANQVAAKAVLMAKPVQVRELKEIQLSESVKPLVVDDNGDLKEDTKP
jgi:hypothetical protein